MVINITRLDIVTNFRLVTRLVVNITTLEPTKDRPTFISIDMINTLVNLLRNVKILLGLIKLRLQVVALKPILEESISNFMLQKSSI